MTLFFLSISLSLGCFFCLFGFAWDGRRELWECQEYFDHWKVLLDAIFGFPFHQEKAVESEETAWSEISHPHPDPDEGKLPAAAIKSVSVSRKAKFLFSGGIWGGEKLGENWKMTDHKARIFTRRYTTSEGAVAFALCGEAQFPFFCA